VKGLLCAGGEATRLGELTRVANKHLLPVGRWPMVYYPLQLLQLAGVRQVLVVTGKQHAGQMIDLLGDGKVLSRDGAEPLFALDLTYKVQTQPGGIAQVVGMAADFAAGEPLVVVLGDNVFEFSQQEAIRAWGENADGALIFAKDVPDPENFGVVVYCYPPDVFDVIAGLTPSSRGELEITDVNRHYAQGRRLAVREVAGWWEDAGKHWQHLAEIGRLVEETGVNKPA